MDKLDKYKKDKEKEAYDKNKQKKVRLILTFFLLLICFIGLKIK